ncbi:hypothetical protein [Natronomonas sp. EA1]|uniref:hypothetical protein n=1 Tax=Natronomonas sp. EA1 TaxID=3421655 RepID=UPI003EBB84F9
MSTLDALVVVYLFALGLGIAVAAGVYLTTDDPALARSRALRALAWGVVGLFPVPLLVYR